MAARIAAQQDISRVELARWDASARAWLLSADEVKNWERTQLRLIIQNCGMSVNFHGSTYASIIDVWVVAMTSLQKLILGMPQRISKAALLLGISAWHIYPDLNVVGPTTHVKFRDSLVTDGGIVTLGLQSSSPDEDGGVRWSLSLAHLRYYGLPVKVSTSGGGNSLRITMEELHMIALGGVLGSWGRAVGDVKAGADWFVALRDAYNNGAEVTLQKRLPWLDLLCSTAARFLESSTTAETDNQRLLLTYGRRKGKRLLGIQDHIQRPMFGFGDIATLANCSVDFLDHDEDVELWIGRLRALAQQCGLHNDNSVILYYKWARPELATAVPGESSSSIDDAHYRWITDFVGPQQADCAGESWCLIPLQCVSFEVENGPTCGKDVLFWKHCPQKFTPTHAHQGMARFYYVAGSVRKAGLYCLPDARPAYISGAQRSLLHSAPTCSEVADFFRSQSSVPWKIRHCLEFVGNTTVQFDTLQEKPIVEAGEMSEELIRKSLVKLMYATTLYNQLPGATISIGVVDKALHAAGWASDDDWISDNTEGLSKQILRDRRAQFSCIAMFESGTLDIDKGSFAEVMALSAGNSIFVHNALLQDPSKQRTSISRLLGNLDRPGVTMLVPPQAPLVRAVDNDTWRLVNHFEFDGKIENSFKDTSLHLSFTDYEIPLNVSIGAVDSEAAMLETLISVYDREQWVADLDVLGSLRYAKVLNCYCDQAVDNPSGSQIAIEDAALVIRDKACQQLISIDCWEELLDPPETLGSSSIAVVRAGENWNARLATACVSHQKGYRTLILPMSKQVCCSCIFGLQKLLTDEKVLIL